MKGFQELYQRARSKQISNPCAENTVFNTLTARFYLTCSKIMQEVLKNCEDAEDATNEFFMRELRQLPSRPDTLSEKEFVGRMRFFAREYRATLNGQRKLGTVAELHRDGDGYALLRVPSHGVDCSVVLLIKSSEPELNGVHATFEIVDGDCIRVWRRPKNLDRCGFLYEVKRRQMESIVGAELPGGGELADFLTDIRECLSDGEFEVIRQIFLARRSLRDAALVLDLSEWRVRQLRDAGVAKLRAHYIVSSQPQAS